MHACSLCVRTGMCVVLIVVLLICGCFYLYINLLSRMHTCIPVVCIYMCVGGGRVWVGLGRYCYVGV